MFIENRDIENRKHPRFNPQGITANISIAPPPPDEHILLNGIVIDMSYTGIRIKLSEKMPKNIPESKIKINLNLPGSGLPFTIQGVIKYMTDDSECGMKYIQDTQEHEIDDFMFECVKSVNAA
ncbi:MAG: hypothetical protein ACI9N9_001908 [Enterobacterales bacterium]|jgi:hypothetical protein